MDERLAETLSQLLTGQERLAGDVKALQVELSTSSERTREEISALFSNRDVLQRDVAKIQRNYVPREALEKHETRQREDLKAFGEQIAGLKVSVTRIMAAAGVVFALIQFAAGWVGK